MGLSTAGKADEGFKVLKRTLEMDPGYVYTHLVLGQAYLRVGKFREALGEFMRERKVAGRGKPYVESWIGVAHALKGDTKKARSALETVKKMSASIYVPPFQIGMMHLVLGEMDKGFEYLNQAYVEKDVWMRSLKVRQPFFPESVRNAPRMVVMLERMHMDE